MEEITKCKVVLKKVIDRMVQCHLGFLMRHLLFIDATTTDDHESLKHCFRTINVFLMFWLMLHLLFIDAATLDDHELLKHCFRIIVVFLICWCPGGPTHRIGNSVFFWIRAHQ